MSVESAAATAAANHALNVQAMKMAALKQQHAAAQSIVQMLEQAVPPAAPSDGGNGVNIKA
jgi:hypothetical protein